MAKIATELQGASSSYVISARACGIIDCHANRNDLRHVQESSLVRIGQKSDYPHLGAHRSVIKLEADSHQSSMHDQLLQSISTKDELRKAYLSLVQGHATSWIVSAIHICARELTLIMRSSKHHAQNPMQTLTFPLHALADGIDFQLNVTLQPYNWPWPQVPLCIQSTILESTLLRCTTITERIGRYSERVTGFTAYPDNTTHVNILIKTLPKAQ